MKKAIGNFFVTILIFAIAVGILIAIMTNLRIKKNIGKAEAQNENITSHTNTNLQEKTKSAAETLKPAKQLTPTKIFITPKTIEITEEIIDETVNKFLPKYKISKISIKQNSKKLLYTYAINKN